MKFAILAVALASASSASCFTLNFVNNCNEKVWAAVGQAPNGQVQSNGVKFGAALGAKGGKASVKVDDHALGIRAWGRTGCDGNGANCKTGKCNGGLVCTDAGITAKAIYSEFGFGDQGQFGGQRTSWDLSFVGGSVNIAARLQSSDGQTVTCTSSSCATNQAFHGDQDFGAVRNSALGATYTHTFCP